MKKRIHVYYSGTVQGVGFRFTAERVANSLGLDGWVKNLNDGRVEVVCEGDEEQLKNFLKKIDEVFRVYIRDTDVAWADETSRHHGFDVRF